MAATAHGTRRTTTTRKPATARKPAAPRKPRAAATDAAAEHEGAVPPTPAPTPAPWQPPYPIEPPAGPFALPAAPGPADVPFQFEPVRLTPQPQRRIPCFYDDDREYTILADPLTGIAAKFIEMCLEGGPVAEAKAALWAVREMLGAEGYDALTTYPGLGPMDFAKICAGALSLLLGSIELPKALASDLQNSPGYQGA